jgi:hypothetical protein
VLTREFHDVDFDEMFPEGIPSIAVLFDDDDIDWGDDER